MKKLLIVLLLALPMLAADLKLFQGSVEAHTEQVMDSKIDIVNHSLHAQISMQDDDITTLSGKFWTDMDAFVSENSDRDENMYESIEATTFKLATYTISSVTPSEEKDVYTINGKLDFHGEEKELIAKAKIVSTDDGLTLNATSMIMFSEYGIEMPCLVFMCVRDQVDLTIKATFN